MALIPGSGGGDVVEDLTPQLGGDLDLNGNQITSPDGTDLIDIPNGSIDLQTNSSSRVDITDSGVRLGGSGARVTTILDEDTMSSDSATALATQQSIKAYVDSNSSSGFSFTSGNSRYHYTGFAGDVSNGTLIYAADSLRYHPFFVWGEATYTRVGLEVTSGAASASIRIGLYSDSNYVPSTLITDYGTVDVSTTGSKEITISETLSPGLYWIAMLSDGAPTLRRQNNSYVLRATGGTASTTAQTHWIETYTYGSLPSTATPISQSATAVHFLWMRVV